jgi:transcriptional regulator NrdR family protein
MVVKKDGTKELYNRDKLKKSIMLAFAKRSKINVEDIQSLISNLETKRLEQGNEITSQTI